MKVEVDTKQNRIKTVDNNVKARPTYTDSKEVQRSRKHS